MRQLLLTWLMCLLAGSAAQGQYITLPDGDYMDTASTRKPTCAKAPTAHYYNVNGKYPRSSETLLKETQAFLRQRGHTYAGSGYVTFRFMVDCTGHRQVRTQVLQTDARYQRFRFSEALVDELYAFLQTLTEWPVAKAKMPVNYLAYLTFKLKDGKVVAVVP
jgi:hypothetical protein